MAVKIRLKRMGAKKRPFYRVVVADARSPRDGRFIESIGYYDPLKDPKVFHVDDERIRHWMATGARPSEAVRELLERQGSLPATAHPVRTKTGPKRAPKPGQSPAAAPVPAPAAPPASAEAVPEADAAGETAAAAESAAEAEPAAETEAPAEGPEPSEAADQSTDDEAVEAADEGPSDGDG